MPWRRAWQPTPVFLPGESPQTEEPGGLQSMGLQRVGHDWVTKIKKKFFSFTWKKRPQNTTFFTEITLSSHLIKTRSLIKLLLLWLELTVGPKSHCSLEKKKKNLVMRNLYLSLVTHPIESKILKELTPAQLNLGQFHGGTWFKSHLQRNSFSGKQTGSEWCHPSHTFLLSTKNLLAYHVPDPLSGTGDTAVITQTLCLWSLSSVNT